MEDVVKKIYVQLDFDHFWTHSERAASNGQSRVQHNVGAIFKTQQLYTKLILSLSNHKDNPSRWVLLENVP